MTDSCDIVVIGSGFGGSIMSLLAAKLGYNVMMLDKTRHPRFAIGESSTPFANLLLERLGEQYDVPELVELSEWGRWQDARPELPAGLKRGFTFLAHEFGKAHDSRRDRQLLVAASPNNELADTHWFRAAFDERLARVAQNHGATLLEDCRFTKLSLDPYPEIEFGQNSRKLAVRARLLIDASGPRGFMHRQLALPELALPHLPATQAVFTHFTDVHELRSDLFAGGPLPFPPDSAAVHHLFPGGWIWALRFNNGIMSAGFSVEEALARELRCDEGAPAWQRLLDRLPTVAQQFEQARPVRPLTHLPRLSFCSAQTRGPGWLMLPSASLFIDPLLSTGFPLTLLGIHRIARLLEGGLDFAEEAAQSIQAEALADGLAAEKLIAALYRNLGKFEMFRELSMLYFAPSIYAEDQVRRGNEQWLDSVPLRTDARLLAEIGRVCDAALTRSIGVEELKREVRALIAPYDLARLTDDSRRNWFPFR